MTNDFLDPNSPYAGLIQMAKPEEQVVQKKNLQEMAKWNALTDAFRLIGEGVTGSMGGTIIPRDSSKTGLYAMDKFMQLDEDYRRQIQNWKNNALNIAVQEGRIRDNRKYQDRVRADDRTWREEQTRQGREFQAGEAEKQRQFTTQREKEQREFTMERDRQQQEDSLKRIEAQGEMYNNRQTTRTNATASNKAILIPGDKGPIEIPANQVGWATDELRQYFANRMEDDTLYETVRKDKLLKKFLDDKTGNLSNEEVTELLTRYKDIVLPGYSEKAHLYQTTKKMGKSTGIELSGNISQDLPAIFNKFPNSLKEAEDWLRVYEAPYIIPEWNEMTDEERNSVVKEMAVDYHTEWLNAK